VVAIKTFGGINFVIPRYALYIAQMVNGDMAAVMNLLNSMKK
jgi:hypothetical protein